MTILECMTDGYTLATGKTTLPSSGSTKYNRLFNLAKILVRNWQNEPGTRWESLWQLLEVGTVTATDEYEISDEFNAISEKDEDKIFIRTTDGADIQYNLVSVADLYTNRYSKSVALRGKQLIFSRAFATGDQEFGGTIYMPAYVKLDEITSVSDDVLIDNPDWLSAAIATRYALADRQLNYLYPDLLAAQNELMQSMKENNERDESAVSEDAFFGASAELE